MKDFVEDFAFRHYGKRVAPSRSGWLTAPGVTAKNGKVTRPVNGTSIFISESRATVFGMHYPDAGIVASAIPFPDFKKTLLFSPPDEKWLSISFGKTGATTDSLVLNLSQAEAVVIEDSGRRCTRSKPKIMEQVAQAVGGLSLDKIRKAVNLQSKRRNDSITRKEGLLFAEIAGDRQKEIVAGVNLLLLHEVNMGLFFNFLRWRKENV